MWEEDGQWWVSIHIKRPRICDFTIEAANAELHVALFNAYKTLCQYGSTERTAIAFDQKLGLYGADPLPTG